jgi:hypothetical protein
MADDFRVVAFREKAALDVATTDADDAGKNPAMPDHIDAGAGGVFDVECAQWQPAARIRFRPMSFHAEFLSGAPFTPLPNTQTGGNPAIVSAQVAFSRRGDTRRTFQVNFRNAI